VDDQRLGAILRAVRIRRRLRLRDVSARCGVSISVLSRIERGHLESMSLATLRRVASALDVRLDIRAFSRAGDLDRLVNARHSALHEDVARELDRLVGWAFHPEVSFSIDGERGVIDILAIHAERRIVLVIELKTEIVDVNELVGTFDRKVRLALRVASERGWARGPGWTVGAWVVVADSRLNRRRAQAHAIMLRAAWPADGRSIRGWLTRPTGPIRCLSYRLVVGSGSAARRVRRPRTDTRPQRRSGTGGLDRCRGGGAIRP
jgi:transcriptional regulator with XRE-family HTH domain